MGMRRKSAGAWGADGQLLRKTGGVWVPCVTFRKVGGAWVAFGNLSVNAPDPPLKIDTGPTITSAAVTAIASGNSGVVSFAWAKVSGGAITAVSGGAAATSFRGTTMAIGETRTAVFRVTATDAGSGQTAIDDVTVTLKRVSQPVATPSVSSISANGTTSTVATAAVTVTITGGTAPFSHAWAKLSGGAISAVAPTSKDTSFRAVNLSVGESRIATFRYTVTDANGIQATCNVDVTIRRTSTLPPPVFTPAAGNYSAEGDGSASFSFACDRVAIWNWTRTSGATGSANIASGGTGTSITFTVNAGLTDKTATFDVSGSVDGVTVNYTLTLTAFGGGGGGDGGGLPLP